MGDGTYAERLLKEPRGDRAQRHAGRGLARTGALQHGSRVVEPVFAHAGEVGVSRPRPAQRGVAPLTRQIVVEWIRTHHLGPFRPFGIGDLDGDGRADGLAETHTGEHADLVLFEFHARTTAISETSACQCADDILSSDVDARRQPLDHGDKRFAVRFTCCLPAQHANTPFLPNTIRGLS